MFALYGSSSTFIVAARKLPTVIRRLIIFRVENYINELFDQVNIIKKYRYYVSKSELFYPCVLQN